MGQTVEELEIELIGKVDGLVKALKKVDKTVDTTTKKAVGNNKKLQSAFRETAASVAAFEGPLGPMAGRMNALGAAIGRTGIAVVGLGGLLLGATLAMKKAIGAASEYNREMGRLGGIIKATGGAAGFSAQEIDRFSRQLGESTLTSASAAREAAGVILTFKSITGDTFKDTLKLAQDMSESGFGALKQTSLQLAKALEEPVLGLNALRRSGVSFTEAQKEMIKGMVEAGDKAAAQKMILKAVSDQVGGAGVAAAQGLAGAMDTLGERIDRAWQLLGDSGPVKAATSAINFLSEAIKDMNLSANNALEAQSKFDDFLKTNIKTMESLGMSINNVDPTSLMSVNRAMKDLTDAGIDLRGKNIALNESQAELIAISSRLSNAHKGLSVAQANYDRALANGSASVTVFKDLLNRFKGDIEILSPLQARLAEETADLATAHLVVADAVKISAEHQKLLDDAYKANERAASKMYDEVEKIIGQADPMAEAITKQANIVNFLQDQFDAGQISAERFHNALKAISEAGPVSKEQDDGDDDKIAKEQEKAAEKLARLDEQYATEEEKLAIHMGNELQIIADAKDAGVILEKDAAERRKKVTDNFHKAKEKLEQKQFNAGLSNAQKFFGGMMSLTQSGSKGLFKLMKAGALASAVINTYASVNKAMAEVPWPANIPAAGAALVSGLANVASIRSTSYGGGGGGGGASTPSAGGGGGGGGTAAPTTPATPETVTPLGSPTGAALTINLGDDDDLMSKGSVRRLINNINDELADGAVLTSIGVA